MSQLKKLTVVFLVVPMGVGLLSFVPEPFLHARAKPPAHVTNIVSFLQWKPAPMGVRRLAVGTNTYWQALGPAGRLVASGPSAYSFDASGTLIGWTPDMGDIYRPHELFGPDVKRETVSLADMKAVMEST